MRRSVQTEPRTGHRRGVRGMGKNTRKRKKWNCYRVFEVRNTRATRGQRGSDNPKREGVGLSGSGLRTQWFHSEAEAKSRRPKRVEMRKGRKPEQRKPSNQIGIEKRPLWERTAVPCPMKELIKGEVGVSAENRRATLSRRQP